MLRPYPHFFALSGGLFSMFFPPQMMLVVDPPISPVDCGMFFTKRDSHAAYPPLAFCAKLLEDRACGVHRPPFGSHNFFQHSGASNGFGR